MKLLKAYIDDKLVIEEVEDASTFFRRFMGLMFRDSMADNHGLLLTPCDEIHTFGMRYAIDTVILDKHNRVIYIDADIAPNKVRKRIKGAKSILELNAGIAESKGIKVGDILIFE